MRRFVWYGGAVLVPFAAQSTWVDALLGLSLAPGLRISLSFLLTMVQVGQASGFQVLLTKSQPLRLGRGAAVPLLVFSLAQLVLLCLLDEGPLVVATSLAISGLVIGISFAIANAHYSRVAPAEYFKRLFYRNLALISVSIVTLNLWADSGAVALCVVSAVASTVSAIRSTEWNGTPNDAYSRASIRDYALVAVGIAAACLYRNDQNVIRVSLGGSHLFPVYHDMLLAGAALQAASGAFVTTVLLPRLCVDGAQSEAIRRLGRAVDACLLLILIAAFGALGARSPVAIILSSALLALNQWWTVQVHAAGKSAHVYATGALAFVVLCLLLRMGTEAGSAYLAYALSTVLLLALSTSRFRNVPAK